MAFVDDFLASKKNESGGFDITPQTSTSGEAGALDFLNTRFGSQESAQLNLSFSSEPKVSTELTAAQAPPNWENVDYSAAALAQHVIDNGITNLSNKKWWVNAPMKEEAWRIINNSPGRVPVGDGSVLTQGTIPTGGQKIISLIGDVLDPNSYLHPGSTENEAAARADQIKKMNELAATSKETAEDIKAGEGSFITSAVDRATVPGASAFLLETFGKQVETLSYGISETADGKIFTGIPAIVFGVTPAGLQFNAATSLPVIGPGIEEVANVAFNEVPDWIIDNTPGLSTAPQQFKDMFKLGIQITEGVIFHKVGTKGKPAVQKLYRGLEKTVIERITTKPVNYSKAEVFQALREINGVKGAKANPKVVAEMRELIKSSGEGAKQLQALKDSYRKGITIREARSFTKWFDDFFKRAKPENVTPTFQKLLTDGKKAASPKATTREIIRFTEEARALMAPEIIQTVGARTSATPGRLTVEPTPTRNLTFSDTGSVPTRLGTQAPTGSRISGSQAAITKPIARGEAVPGVPVSITSQTAGKVSTGRIPKVLEPLAIEARKFKSAEKFSIEAQRVRKKSEAGKVLTKAEQIMVDAANHPFLISSELKAIQGENPAESFYNHVVRKTAVQETVLKAPVSIRSQTAGKLSTRGIPKELQPLAREAQKFTSADEFVKSIKTEPTTKTGKAVIIKSYHGTSKQFEKFEIQREGTRYSGDGIYFTPDKVGAKHFAGTKGRVIESYLELRKPYVSYLPEGNIDFQYSGEFIQELKNEGYDSMIVRIKDTVSEDWVDEKGIVHKKGSVESDNINEIVVFDVSVIKAKSDLTDLHKQATEKPGKTPKKTEKAAAPDTDVSTKKTSGVAKSVERKALEKGIIDSLEVRDLAGFDAIVRKEQAKIATDLILNDFQLAMDILKGIKPLPQNLRGPALTTAMENHAMTTRDGQLSKEVMSSPLQTELSKEAQDLGLAAEREPDSAVTKMKHLKAVAEKAAEKKRHGKSKKQAKAKLEGDLKAKVKKRKVTKKTFERFLDEIGC